MKRIFRHRRRRLCHWIIPLISILSVVSICGTALFRCRGILHTYAESQAVWMVTKLANDTAMQVLGSVSDVCANVISVAYNDNNRVSSVTTNTERINQIRSSLTMQVMNAIERDSSISVSLPLGTLSGIYWLSGYGPLVTFPISFTATVLSSVSSRITAVAINQSVYSVVIQLYFEMFVVTPGGRSAVTTTVGIPMAEAVMLGEIPDNLTEVYGDDQSLTGQIFDYGAAQ